MVELNPFYEHVKPNPNLNAPTVCEMERSWDVAIDTVIKMMDSDLANDQVKAVLAKVKALKSTNQRGDPTIPKRNKFKVNVMLRDGPLSGQMLLIETVGGPGTIFGINTEHGIFKYKLLNGPALQAAMKDGKEHPNLSASATYVSDNATNHLQLAP